MATLRDPDQNGMVTTLYPSAHHTPNGFGLGPLMAEIWAFFQILGHFLFFYFDSINSHGQSVFHRKIIKIGYNLQTDARKKILGKKFEKNYAQFFFLLKVWKPEEIKTAMFEVIFF